MSGSNQDSGIFGAVAAVGLLVIIGGGFFGYQRMRIAQMALVKAEQQRAMEAAQLAVAKEAILQTQSTLQLQKVFQAEPAAELAAEERIRAKLRAQQSDWNQGDLDAFMKVYWKSEQLTFASGGKLTRGWQATLDGYKSKYSTKEKLGVLTFDDLEFQQLDQSIILVLGTWHLDRGTDSVGGNFSLLWKKIENDWLIIHDHTSVLTSAK